MARYTATHGVSFADAKIQFEYDREATGSSREKVYVADLDAKQVAALGKIDDKVLAEYGIAKDDSKPKADADSDEG